MTAIRQRCAERGEDNELIFLGFHATLVNTWRGDYAAARTIADEIADRAMQLGGDLPMFVAYTVRALVGSYTGDVDAVRRDTAYAEAAGRRCSSQRLVETPITTMGFLEVSLGRHEQALAVLEPLIDGLSRAPDAGEIMSAAFVPDAVEALCAVGRVDEADRLTAILERNGERLQRPWLNALGARGRALVLAARGEQVGAAAAVAAALDHHRGLDMPFELARTELLAGQVARRNRRRDLATTTLRNALAAFEALGTPLWAERARAELGRVDVSLRRTDGLTATELRVAELAASGATNRDMAAALFVSPKTVEANLTRIYRKLDVRSRTELARAMAARKE